MKRPDEGKYMVREEDEDNVNRKITNVEDALIAVKPYGTFQKILNVLLCFLHGPAAYSTRITYFIINDSEWKCVSNSTSCTFNGTQSGADDRKCNLDKSQWEFTQSPETSIKLDFDLYCGREWAIHMATTSLYLGWAIGSFMISYLADRFGRKMVLLPCYVLIILAGFLSIFSPNIELFIFLRFLIGIVITGNYHILFLVMGEFVDNKHRPHSVNMINISMAVWSCILCLKAYYISNWKILTIATTVPYVIVVCFYKVLPETLHWLQLHGRKKKLLAVLERICYWNKVKMPQNIQLSDECDSEEDAAKPTTSSWDLFRTPLLRSRTLRLLYAWFVVGLLYISITWTASDLTGSMYRDFFILIAAEIPGLLIANFCCNRLGRKKTVSIAILMASVALFTIAFIPNKGNVRIARLALGVLGKTLCTLAFTSFYTWTLELYGTDLRSIAMGVCNTSIRIGSAASPWIGKALVNSDTMSAYIVMGSLGFICGLVMLTLPETKNVVLRNLSQRRTETHVSESEGLEI